MFWSYQIEGAVPDERLVTVSVSGAGEAGVRATSRSDQRRDEQSLGKRFRRDVRKLPADQDIQRDSATGPRSDSHRGAPRSGYAGRRSSPPE